MHIPLLIFNITPFLRIPKNENEPNLTHFRHPLAFALQRFNLLTLQLGLCLNWVHGADHRPSRWPGFKVNQAKSSPGFKPIKPNQVSKLSQIRLNQGRSSLIKVNQAIFFFIGPKAVMTRMKPQNTPPHRHSHPRICLHGLWHP